MDNLMMMAILLHYKAENKANSFCLPHFFDFGWMKDISTQVKYCLKKKREKSIKDKNPIDKYILIYFNDSTRVSL